MTDAYGLLLHALMAAATPLPVTVDNFPGPDRVATDTLLWAQLTFWATVFIGIPALIFAFVDYLLNMRQFRRPKLAVALAPSGNAILDSAKVVRIQPHSYRGDNRDYEFNVNLRVTNSGKRAGNGCFVAIWVPSRLGTAGTGWNTIDKSDVSVWELAHGEYQCHETFLTPPVFVEHAVMLPPLTLHSQDGPTAFDIYWQVFDEFGKRESTRKTPFKVAVSSDTI